MNRKLLAASLAALALALTAGTALAATATAKQAVNIRDAAGTRSNIVGHLGKGQRIEVFGCSQGWCETPRGYVSASYLTLGAALADDDDEEDEDEDEDDDDGGISAFDPDDGTFDEDPLGFEDGVAASIKSSDDDDDD